MKDLSEQNFEQLHSIHLHNMSIEELVKADSEVESRFHFSRGIWWREVKPFFYQPSAFMTRIIPQQSSPKPWLAFGGYYHMVPEEAFSNGSIIVNEISNPSTYKLEDLKQQARYDIRRGFSNLKISRITDLNDLLGDGYRIYLLWEGRTKGVRVKRSRREVFQQWISRVFNHPYNLILGAYLENRLIAYIIAHAANGVADLSKSFSDLSFRQFYPSSALMYAYIVICGQNPEIRKACAGLKSHKISLDRFKKKFNFSQVPYPAYIRLRSFIRPLVRWLMPIQYKRLMGQYN